MREILIWLRESKPAQSYLRKPSLQVQEEFLHPLQSSICLPPWRGEPLRLPASCSWQRSAGTRCPGDRLLPPRRLLAAVAEEGFASREEQVESRRRGSAWLEAAGGFAEQQRLVRAPKIS